MSQCLVTKLKASVNNPDLPYFDNIYLRATSRLDVPTGLYFTITSAEKTPFELISEGETNFTKSYNGESLGKRVTSQSGQQWYLRDSLKEDKIRITNASNITIIQGRYVRVIPSEASKCPKLKEYTIFDPGNDTDPSLWQLNDLASCLLLEKIKLDYCLNMMGNITTMATSQVAKGRISGTLSILGLKPSPMVVVPEGVSKEQTVYIHYGSSYPNGYKIDNVEEA